MIVVRIEKWPGGDRDRGSEVASIFIANDGTGDEVHGNYHVAAHVGDEVHAARVEGHRRHQGAIALLRAVLAALESA